MSGAFVTSEMVGLDAVLARINALGQPRRIAEGLALIGGLVENQTKRRIEEERTSPEGEAWAPWSEAYAAGRHKGNRLLQASGAFRDSIAWDLTGDALRVGSNMVFAALHQFGGVEGMAPGPAAVPARPWLGLSADNIEEIETAMGDWIAEVLQ